jgi:hydroxypyruvate isomerase
MSRRRLVLRGARWPGDVALDDGRILAVGQVEPEEGDTVLRCDGDIITAGLVNTHHHFYQWMTRGRAVGCDLFGWLSELYPVWARLSPEDVHAAALVALAELALTGCTTAADHHYVVPGGDDSVFDAVADAARTIGIRVHVARGSMDLGESKGGLPPDFLVEELDAILASTESVAGRLHDGERVVVTVAPCSPFSVTPELMRESAALARRLGLRLHTHLAETLDEERDAVARFGRRPVDLVEELGWVAGDVWLAHGIHFNDDEVRRLGAAGTGVAHCPSSNARLGSGLARRWGSGSTGWPPTRSAGSSRSSARRSTQAGSAPAARPTSCPPPRWPWPPRAGPPAWAATTSAGWSPATGPTWSCGRATTSPTCPTPWTGWCWGPTGARGTCWWTVSRSSATGTCSVPTRARSAASWPVGPGGSGQGDAPRCSVMENPLHDAEGRMAEHALPYEVNCSILFTELPLLERPAAAKEAGFGAVEFWWPFASAVPSDREVDGFVRAVGDAGVRLAGLNFFAGDMPGGDRGLVSWPARSGEFRDNVDVTVGIGERLGCRAFNALYGNRVDDADPTAQDDLAVENLALAGRAAARIGGTVLVEPVSGADRYPLLTAADSVAVIDRVADETGVGNLGLLCDLYHLAVNGDDLDQAIATYADRVAHVQIADAPGRHEPGTGTLDLDHHLADLAAAGYGGWVGLEYKPSGASADSFGWLPRERRGRGADQEGSA